MLNKTEIDLSVNQAAAACGDMLRSMRRARGIRLVTISQAVGLSIAEIDKIENGCMDTLNLENVIRLAAFYDKRLYIDFRHSEND